MIDRLKLLDTILDNQDASDSVLILKVENVISESLGFNHSEKDVKKACNITRDKKDISIFKVEYDKVSQEIEALEKTLTKREIAFMTVLSSRKDIESTEIMKLIELMKKLKGKE